MDRPLKHLYVAVGPGQRQGGDKIRAPVLVAQFVLDALHGHVKIFAWSGPAGRIDAGVAAQRRHNQARVVRYRRLVRTLDGGAGLDFGVGDEGQAVLHGFRKAQFTGR